MMASMGEASRADQIPTDREERGADGEAEDVPHVPQGDEGLRMVQTNASGLTFARTMYDFGQWGVRQLKCNVQAMGEYWGTRSRTVDLQLTDRVGHVRVARATYVLVIAQATKMRRSVEEMGETQRQMAYLLTDMSSPNARLPVSLYPAMKRSAAAQLTISEREKLLLAALDSFIGNVTTMIRTAFDDLLSRVPEYKALRVEYDSYRNDLESARAQAKGMAAARRQEVLQRAEDAFRPHEERFMSVRRQFRIRVQFLEQHESSTMHKQLVLLQNAMCGFYSENNEALYACLKEFHIKVPKLLHDRVTSSLAASEEDPLTPLPIPSLESQRPNVATPSISPLPH